MLLLSIYLLVIWAKSTWISYMMIALIASMVIKNRENLLAVLLIFEMLTLLILGVMATALSASASMVLSLFIYMTCAVCEACVGLSLLVSASRSHTSSMFKV